VIKAGGKLISLADIIKSIEDDTEDLAISDNEARSADSVSL
jgi:hypothetical protein